jgi:hypothetical protein
MKHYPSDLNVDTFNSHYTENEFFNKYLCSGSFRGFYYDANERSFGITLQFPNNHKTKLSIYAKELQGIVSITEYHIVSRVFVIENVAYDKVLISTSKYIIESALPGTNAVKLPACLEFTLQLLTRNSLFIRFLSSDQYGTPIGSFKGGLVLARETNQNYEKEMEESGMHPWYLK